MSEQSKHASLLLDFVAGALGGMIATLVGHPFDTVKVRYQNPEITAQYQSTLSAILIIVKEEKLSGLYKGVTSPLLTGPLLNGVLFMAYSVFLSILATDPKQTPSLLQVTLAGLFAGFVCSLINTPTELLKIQQQIIQARTYNSARVPSSSKIVAHILRLHGISGLFRGQIACALRDGPGYALYFLPYEAICRAAIQYSEAGRGYTPWSALLFGAAVAGVVGWTSTFPFDVVKTRMQSVDLSDDASDANLNSSLSSTIRHAYKTNGIGIFVYGLAPTLWRAVPMTVITFGVHEAAVQALS